MEPTLPGGERQETLEWQSLSLRLPEVTPAVQWFFKRHPRHQEWSQAIHLTDDGDVQMRNSPFTHDRINALFRFVKAISIIPSVPSPHLESYYEEPSDHDVQERIRQTSHWLQWVLRRVFPPRSADDTASHKAKSALRGEFTDRQMERNTKMIQAWINAQWNLTILPVIREMHAAAEAREWAKREQLRTPLCCVKEGEKTVVMILGKDLPVGVSVVHHPRDQELCGCVHYYNFRNGAEVAVYVLRGATWVGKGEFAGYLFDFSKPTEGFRIFLAPAEDSLSPPPPEGGTLHE